MKESVSFAEHEKCQLGRIGGRMSRSLVADESALVLGGFGLCWMACMKWNSVVGEYLVLGGQGMMQSCWRGHMSSS